MNTPDKQPATADPATFPKAEEELLDKMTDAFLRWELPASVRSDLCVTMSDHKHPRYGTSLMTVVEAQQMFKEVVLPLIGEPETFGSINDHPLVRAAQKRCLPPSAGTEQKERGEPGQLNLSLSPLLEELFRQDTHLNAAGRVALAGRVLGLIKAVNEANAPAAPTDGTTTPTENFLREAPGFPCWGWTLMGGGQWHRLHQRPTPASDICSHYLPDQPEKPTVIPKRGRWSAAVTSDTPRTDAHRNSIHTSDVTRNPFEVINRYTDFAKHLEADLNATSRALSESQCNLHRTWSPTAELHATQARLALTEKRLGEAQDSVVCVSPTTGVRTHHRRYENGTFNTVPWKTEYPT